MTFDNDYLIKTKEDWELWNEWVKFVGIHHAKPLPDLLRHIYAVALSMPQDEPFVGNAMQELIKELNRKPWNNKDYHTDNATFAAYKKKIKTKGWLNADGTLIKSIAAVRDVYREDAKKGVRSISLIYKICVC